MTPDVFVGTANRLAMADYSYGFDPDVSHDAAPPEPIVATEEEAVAYLEEVVASQGAVTASVRSTPSLLDVTYWPVYRKPGPADPVITTDHDVSLRMPVSYYFEATDPRTGTRVRKRAKCTRGCTVVFTFDPED